METKSELEMNFLRWITGGQLPDDVLESCEDFRLEGDTFKFKFRAQLSLRDWRIVIGSSGEEKDGR